MRNNKAKEQLLAIITLFSVFVFIIYLKMNPEISSNSFSVNHVVNQDQDNIDSIVDDNVDQIIDTDNQDKQALTNDDGAIDNADTTDDNSIIAFTQRELNRAKSYQDRNWKADGTINMAAWDYVLNNPNFNDGSDIDSDVQFVNIAK